MEFETTAKVMERPECGESNDLLMIQNIRSGWSSPGGGGVTARSLVFVGDVTRDGKQRKTFRLQKRSACQFAEKRIQGYCDERDNETKHNKGPHREKSFKLVRSITANQTFNLIEHAS